MNNLEHERRMAWIAKAEQAIRLNPEAVRLEDNIITADDLKRWRFALMYEQLCEHAEILTEAFDGLEINEIEAVRKLLHKSDFVEFEDVKEFREILKKLSSRMSIFNDWKFELLDCMKQQKI